MASILKAVTNNVFDPNNDIPDLSGKVRKKGTCHEAFTDCKQVYVVTGGSAGIGYGIVAHILQHKPEKIYLLSNKEEHANEAQEALKEWGDSSKIEWRKCNLEDLKQTDDVAKNLAKELTRLDALVCNAGLGVGVYNETEHDKLDSHMQVNIFSQAHLTLVLLPVLQKTQDSRIVYPTLLYNRTKLAQIVFLRELYLRIKSGQFGEVTGTKGLPWINATHPGAVSTDQPKQAEEAYGTCEVHYSFPLQNVC
jgi:WW domain-containing oxidoreductase